MTEQDLERLLNLDSQALTKHAVRPENIAQDRYDRTVYDELRQASTAVASLEQQGAETFPALLQDFWAAFYKADPALADESKVQQPHRTINRPFVERLLEDSATQEARLTTMLDELASAVAAVGAGQAMLKEFNERAELQEAQRLAQQARRQEERGDEQGAQESMEKAEALLQGSARGVRRTVREAVQAGQEKAEQVQQVLAGWGLEPRDIQNVPIGDRLQMAERLTTQNLERVADLVGRMRNLAQAKQRNKVKKQRDEVHSITVGSDLPHVLPAELAALRHPLRRLDFYRRYTERQLLQYDLQTTEKLTKGPIVTAIDTSGSMAGMPLEWAVSVALALASIASKQKRACHAMFFDTRVHHEYTFMPGEKDVEKFVQMATMGVGGGTAYEPALDRAVEVMSEQAFKQADVLMVTDGMCRMTDEKIQALTAWKRPRGVRFYTVLLGSPYGSEHLGEWNDKVWRVTDLSQTGDETAGEIFEEV